MSNRELALAYALLLAFLAIAAFLLVGGPEVIGISTS